MISWKCRQLPQLLKNKKKNYKCVVLIKQMLPSIKMQKWIWVVKIEKREKIESGGRRQRIVGHDRMRQGWVRCEELKPQKVVDNIVIRWKAGRLEVGAWYLDKKEDVETSNDKSQGASCFSGQSLQSTAMSFLSLLKHLHHKNSIGGCLHCCISLWFSTKLWSLQHGSRVSGWVWPCETTCPNMWREVEKTQIPWLYGYGSLIMSSLWHLLRDICCFLRDQDKEISSEPITFVCVHSSYCFHHHLWYSIFH